MHRSRRVAVAGADRRGPRRFLQLLLAGAGGRARTSTTRTLIHPEWQDLRVGDTVWLARRYGEAARQVVAAVEPNSHLVLMSPDDFERVQRGEKASGAWGFYLREEGGWTRLVVRGSGGAVGHAGFDIPHFVMEQKMMRGIRDRARTDAPRRRSNAFVQREYRSVRDCQQPRQIVVTKLRYPVYDGETILP